MTARQPRVVALGGGHGLAASLTALRQLTTELTAVVTVADNGGSSGRLRQEFGALPPGDLRMALAALCGDDEWGRTWARVLQHRFESTGPMHGHALGNLLIVALWELLGEHVEGLDWVARLLEAKGRVLPIAVSPLDIVAQVRGADGGHPDAVTQVRGQIQVATTSGTVERVCLDPGDAVACPEALEAIGAANWIVLGPGSWYSSVIPHLLVPGVLDTLAGSRGTVLLNLNLVAQRGETEGLTPAEHFDAFVRHAPGLTPDVVLADRHAVAADARLPGLVAASGGRLEVADLALDGVTGQHDPEKLHRAYARVMLAS